MAILLSTQATTERHIICTGVYHKDKAGLEAWRRHSRAAGASALAFVYVGKYVCILSSHESRRPTYTEYFQVTAEVHLFDYHQETMLPLARALVIVAAWGTGGQIVRLFVEKPPSTLSQSAV